MRTLASRTFPRMAIEQRDVLISLLRAVATTSSAFVFVWQSCLPWMTPSKPLLSSKQFRLQKLAAVQPLQPRQHAEKETRQGHVVVPTSPVAAVHDALASTMKEMVNVLRGMSSDGATRGGYSGRRRPIECWHCGEVGHVQARCPYLTVAGWNKPIILSNHTHALRVYRHSQWVQVGLGVMEEAMWCT